jgi:hypothetical protein
MHIFGVVDLQQKSDCALKLRSDMTATPCRTQIPMRLFLIDAQWEYPANCIEFLNIQKQEGYHFANSQAPVVPLFTPTMLRNYYSREECESQSLSPRSA